MERKIAREESTRRNYSFEVNASLSRVRSLSCNYVYLENLQRLVHSPLSLRIAMAILTLAQLLSSDKNKFLLVDVNYESPFLIKSSLSQR